MLPLERRARLQFVPSEPSRAGTKFLQPHVHRLPPQPERRPVACTEALRFSLPLPSADSQDRATFECRPGMRLPAVGQAVRVQLLAALAEMSSPQECLLG